MSEKQNSAALESVLSELLARILRVEEQLFESGLAYTILQRQGQMASIALPHHAAQGSTCIFEREIDVPGSGPPQVGNLTLHPDILQGHIRLQQGADVLRQAGNCPGDGSKKRGLGHLEKDTPILEVLQVYEVKQV